MAPTPDGWTLLGTPSEELRLDCTLPTGQSFRWRELAPGALYVGVLGRRAVALRQLDGDVAYRVLARAPDAAPAGDAAAVGDYFNLDVSLAALAKKWRAADPNFARLADVLPGARMLRQDPVECLFSFICSQNNHISRIHGMVNRLCETYGTPLALPAAERAAVAAAVEAGAVEESKGAPALPPALYAFPTLDQLAAATEDELRVAGFGYRARYIVGAVEELRERPEGGAAWLTALRAVPFDAAVEALCTLPGVGPKVAACVALFSLDKHEAVPVDVHVWALATRRYVPALHGKPNNPKAHPQVQAAFTKLFGPYAGWAHNTLFIGELGMMKERVRAVLGDVGSEEESDEGMSSDSDSEVDSEEETELFAPAGKRVKVEDSGDAAAPTTPETGAAPVREVKRRRAAVKATKSMRQARERAAEVAAAIKAE